MGRQMIPREVWRIMNPTCCSVTAYGGDDQVTLVLPVGIVDHHHHVATGDRFDKVLDWSKAHIAAPGRCSTCCVVSRPSPSGSFAARWTLRRGGEVDHLEETLHILGEDVNLEIHQMAGGSPTQSGDLEGVWNQRRLRANLRRQRTR